MNQHTSDAGMRTLRRWALLAIAVSAPVSHLAAQQNAFTPEELFRGKGPGLTRPMPVLEWIDDAQYLMTLRPHRDSAASTFVVDVATGVRREVSPAGADSLRRPHERVSVTIREDDVYVRRGSTETRLTTGPEREQNATISPDTQRVAFTRQNDLYVVDIATGRERRLTTDGSSDILNGYASWVYMEEILGRRTAYRAFWWSPDGKTLAFFRTDDSPVPVLALVSPDGKHGRLEEQRYPKAGDENPFVRIGFAHVADGKVVWADFPEGVDEYFGTPIWRPDSRSCIIQWMNRGQDTLRLFDVDPSTGEKTQIYQETRHTWIDLDDDDRITFVNAGEFILKSSRTGWSCFSLYDRNARFRHQITTGQQVVRSIVFCDTSEQVLFFLARNENSARTDLYRVRFDGSAYTRLTQGEFNNSVLASPGGKYFLVTRSNVSTPPRTILMDRKGRPVREVFDSRNPEVSRYALPVARHLRIPSDDSLYALPVNIVYPVGYSTSRRYPVLMSIYGGPNAPSVSDAWQLTPERVWWAQEGIVQVECDHRGSGHFGQAGADSMHRNLGYWELRDYSRVARWLISAGVADSARIAIAGYSYGGYVVAYALTYGADVFTHGLAGGSVVDWKLYDTHYTERYMDTPQENPEGYARSSVLTHVQNYRGALLIVHGMMDDNVHVQNSLQLADALQKSNKPFELMLYPESRHGIRRGARAHADNLDRAFIYRHLLGRPMPKEVREQ